MKYNLKNRPKLGDYPHQATKKLLKEFAEKVPEWFDGFEQEIRKRIKQNEKYLPCSASLTENCCFKEILGEGKEKRKTKS